MSTMTLCRNAVELRFSSVLSWVSHTLSLVWIIVGQYAFIDNSEILIVSRARRNQFAHRDTGRSKVRLSGGHRIEPQFGITAGAMVAALRDHAEQPATLAGVLFGPVDLN